MATNEINTNEAAAKRKKNIRFASLFAFIIIAGGSYGMIKYIHSQKHEETDDAQIEALLGHSPQALALLREAFEKHYPAEYAAGDEDLRNLAGNPEFVALVKQYSKNPK